MAITTAKVFVKKDENHVEIIRSGNVVLSYKDKIINSNSFERFIDANHYICVKEGDEYKLQLFSVKKPVRFIEPKKVDKAPCSKIITMDLETLNTNGKMSVAYANFVTLSWFDGDIIKYYFRSDFNSSDDLIIKAISVAYAITKVKYRSYKIYLHNFSNFDAVFFY